MVGPGGQIRAAAQIQSGAAGLHPASRPPPISAATPSRCGPSRACRCWISAAAADCCPSRWRGWALPSPGPMPRKGISAPPAPMPPRRGSPIDYRAATAEASGGRRPQLRRGAQHGSGRACRRCRRLSRGLRPAGEAGRHHDRRHPQQDPEVAWPWPRFGAEYVLGWLPRGTHDWNRFIPPAELQKSLEESRANHLENTGCFFDV